MTNVGQTSYVTICDIVCNDSDSDEKNRWAAGQMGSEGYVFVFSGNLWLNGKRRKRERLIRKELGKGHDWMISSGEISIQKQ